MTKSLEGVVEGKLSSRIEVKQTRVYGIQREYGGGIGDYGWGVDLFLG